MRRFGLLALVLLFAGCAMQPAVTPEARLARYVGMTEAELVQRHGPPAAREQVGGHQVLVYRSGYSEWVQASPFDQDPPELKGLDYNGLPPRLLTWSCETRFDMEGGRVAAAHQRGNYCGGSV